MVKENSSTAALLNSYRMYFYYPRVQRRVWQFLTLKSYWLIPEDSVSWAKHPLRTTREESLPVSIKIQMNTFLYTFLHRIIDQVNGMNKLIIIPPLWLCLLVGLLLQGSKWFGWKVEDPRENGTEKFGLTQVVWSYAFCFFFFFPTSF